MQAPDQAFTASKYAVAARMSRFSVYRRLRALQPAGTMSASVWRIGELPADLLRTIDAEAKLHSYDAPLAYLAAISGRPGEEPQPVPVPESDSPCPGGCDLRQLAELLKAYPESKQLNFEETELFWQKVLYRIRSLTRESSRPKRVRRACLSLIWRERPSLAKSFAALGKTFYRMWSEWARLSFEVDKLNLVTQDGRHGRLGAPTAPAPDPEQLGRLQFYQVNNTGCRLAQAQRELTELGLLTDPRLVKSPDSRKSYVKQSIRDRTRDSQALFAVTRGGERAVKQMSPPIELEYDGIFSMDCVTGDDLTAPVYFWVTDPKERFGYRLTRGQVILICDFRTLKILSFKLSPERQYTALDVRSALRAAFEEHGLPKFVYREGGIWRNSKAVNSLGRAASLSNEDVEARFGRRAVLFRDNLKDLCQDLGDLRLQFREAYKPNAKPVERVCGLVQDLMEGEPGYCGRLELRDLPAETRKNLELARTGKAHPKELGLYSYDEWYSRAQAIFERYNASRQEGKRLRHPQTGEPLSPDEGFEVFRNREDPPTRFDDSCRFMLSHARMEVTVQMPNVNKRRLPCGYVRVFDNTYCDGQTGSRIGQRLIAFYNPEFPETCTLTDLNMCDPFTVPLYKPTNALYGGETLKETIRQGRETIKPIVTKARTLKDKYAPIFRGLLVSGQTKAVAEEIQRGGTAQKAAKRNARRATALASRVALPADATPEEIEAVENALRYKDQTS
jgi:hypothetical protein